MKTIKMVGICLNLDLPSGYCKLVNKNTCLDGFICCASGKCRHPFPFKDKADNCDYLKMPDVKK
jgi:hypothetical protein